MQVFRIERNLVGPVQLNLLKMKWTVKNEIYWWYLFHHQVKIRLPISQRSDDQPIRAAQILILISERDVSDGDPCFVQVLFEVEPALFQPFEVVYRSNAKADQSIENVPLMDVDGDQSFKFHPFQFGQIPGRLIDQSVQKFQKSVVCFGHHFLVTASLKERRFRISRPHHLDAQNSDLEVE